MRVAIDGRFWGSKYAGLGRYTQNLIQNLMAVDQANIYTILIEEPEQIPDLPKNVHLHQLVVRPHSLQEQIKLHAFISRSKFDLIHFPHNIVPIRAITIPFVITIHDLIRLKYHDQDTTTLGRYRFLIKKYAYRVNFWRAISSSAHIIVPSNHVKDQLSQIYHLAPQKITVTYEGFDRELAEFVRDPIEAAPIKGRYVLYYGAAYPHKNIETLIQALKFLPNDMQLILVGKEDFFWQRLMEQYSDQPRVKYLGYVADAKLAQLIRHATAFVTATREEGFGLPPLEALSLGCPVVVSNIPVFHETLGSAALYADPSKPRDYAQMVQRIIDDPVIKESALNQGESLSRSFSWRRMAEQTLAVYRSVLA